MRRRALLRLLLLGGLAPAALRGALAAPPRFATVAPEPLVFPRDHGAHPDYRTEWWYATGWLETPQGPAGFQITFFRSRTGHDPANPSRFAPHQLLFAHAALAWPALGRLRHEQRAARVVRGDPTAAFADDDTDLVLQGWRFRREVATGVYSARIDGDALRLDLQLAPTQALLLQGEGGYSRKGPDPAQASRYYSQPQLAVSGQVGIDGASLPVTGRAWLDHEWSTTVLDGQAVGWDWVGINLDDGGALMAFVIRAAEGAPPRWAAARLRQADGRLRSFGAGEVRFETLATWRSPRTGTVYPVRRRVVLGVGTAGLAFELQPLFEDQELDGRLSTGAVYWEGAVSVLRDGRPVGRGYLELVGYHRPMKL
jgi:predicted secreted hydrolase